MKFAIQLLMCNYAENFALKAVQNCYPFVDKIYIANNNRSWEENRPTNVDLSIFHPYKDKIEIVNGSWDSEANERNTCLEIAKRQGMDMMILQDHDEFYFNDHYEYMLKTMEENKDLPLFMVPLMPFWKTFNYVLVDKNMKPAMAEAFFSINLKSNIVFRRARRPSYENGFLLKDSICFHGSYVLNDEECLEKLSTWSHARQFNVREWYDEVWLKWTPETTGLHPIAPDDWYKAIPYNKEDLPEILR